MVTMTIPITSEELSTRWKDYLTLADLKRFAEEHNIPDTAKILVERVPDMYYDGVDISGMRGCDIPGSNGIFPPGSKASGWRVYPKDRGDEGISEYSPAFCCVGYKDEKQHLFINLHY